MTSEQLKEQSQQTNPSPTATIIVSTYCIGLQPVWRYDVLITQHYQCSTQGLYYIGERETGY